MDGFGDAEDGLGLTLAHLRMSCHLQSHDAGVNQSVKWFVDNYATARKGH